MSSLRVLIAGGGMGGLCLAQGLHRAGIAVTVFERDASVRARSQGYRLRIDAAGDSALRECLPSNLYELYIATANRPSRPPVAAFDHHLNVIYRMGGASGQADLVGHLAVNRQTLRQVLLTGLEDTVQFGYALAGFEQDTGGVYAGFSNGQSVRGDVLVAADGILSAVRRQLLPEARIVATGMRCIYGRIPLNEDILHEIPEPLFCGFTPVLGPERRTLALGMYRSRRPVAEAVAEFAPDAVLDPVPDYLMWVLVFPDASDEAPNDDPGALHRAARKMTGGWHPDLCRLLERADVPATFSVPIRTSRPVPPWPTTRVTLLGDAIHAMTPAGGIGANTALRDAALLTKHLTDADQGTIGLNAAIACYEDAMRDYGFAAVESSLRAGGLLYRIGAEPGKEAPS